MNKQEALRKIEELTCSIEELKKFVEEFDNKPSRYATVKFGEQNHVLLINSDNEELVSCWIEEVDLNDFKYFDTHDHGHFRIDGTNKPFEIINIYGDVLFESSDLCRVRFLEK